MRALSLFSGIGGFDLGLERAGFEVIGQCEIDPFCNKVLAKHWPGVPRYGDVRDIGIRQERGRLVELPISHPEKRGWGLGWQQSIDLVVGGFPCQDLSVAGKRAGLAGDRSGLWFEFHRILSELRPTFCLIENVPGLLSSNNGRDFAVVLDGLGELWPAVGWAVLDSQHFGVPQRRRRVYIIGGPSRACVQQILSLCEGGDWHPQTGRETGQDVAAPLGASATSFGGQRYDLDNETYVPRAAYSLTARAAQDRPESGAATLIAHTLSADGFDASEDGTGRGTPLTIIDMQNAAAVASVGTLNSGGAHYNRGFGVATSTVRRLTPVECLRLQGFPDDWCDVPGVSDGAIYRAAGNAVTVPVIEYLGLRIKAVLYS